MTKSNEDLIKTFNEALAAEIKNIDETMIPLLREYLKNVREIRMSIAAEVRTIVQEARNLNEAVQIGAELHRFIDGLVLFDRVITPELLDKLRKISKGFE